MTTTVTGRTTAIAVLKSKANDFRVGNIAAGASKGWLSLSPAAVARRVLAEDRLVRDVTEVRDFIRQTVRVTVRAVGSGRRVPVAERIAVEVLTPQNGIVLREVPVPIRHDGDFAYVAVAEELA